MAQALKEAAPSFPWSEVQAFLAPTGVVAHELTTPYNLATAWVVSNHLNPDKLNVSATLGGHSLSLDFLRIGSRRVDAVVSVRGDGGLINRPIMIEYVGYVTLSGATLTIRRAQQGSYVDEKRLEIFLNTPRVIRTNDQRF